MAGAPQDHTTVVAGPYQYTSLGYAQVTLTATAQTLKQLLATANAASPKTSLVTDVPTGTRMILAVIETANIRWIDDGQVPTTTYGNLYSAGQSFDFSGDPAAILLIAVSGSPVLNLTFYK